LLINARLEFEKTMGKVIMLTGAPATGKSTLRRNLAARIPGLVEFDYGELLRQRKASEGTALSYDELRSQSASVIHATDVQSVDEFLIREVTERRLTSDVIIDSHAVTRETFGFRVIPFSHGQLMRLRLDGVLVLRCSIEKMMERIAAAPEGRRDVSASLAAEHQALQECVGMTYGIICGCQVFIIDVTDMGEKEVTDTAVKLLEKIGVTATTRQ